MIGHLLNGPLMSTKVRADVRTTGDFPGESQKVASPRVRGKWVRGVRQRLSAIKGPPEEMT